MTSQLWSVAGPFSAKNTFVYYLPIWKKLQNVLSINFPAYEVSGYPTFKYFKYFDKERKSYDGGRTKDDFIAFMKDPENPLSGKPPPVPTPEEAWADHEG